MKTLKDFFYPICAMYNLEIVEFSATNGIVQIKFRGPRIERPNRDIFRAIAALDCIDKIYTSKYNQGKKVENCSYHVLNARLAGLYFHTELDLSKATGRMIKFVKDNEIKTTKDFMDNTIDMIHNMSKMAHISDPSTKKKYRLIKKAYITFLYRNGLIDEMKEQISYCNDRLTLFVIGDYSFHLRTAHVRFLMDYENEVEVIDKIYQKKSIDAYELDMSFENHLDILSHVNNSQIFEHVGIKVNKVKYESLPPAPPLDIFERTFLSSIGFTVTKDDGQYGEAVDTKTGGMTKMQWNREGHSCTYFGGKLDKNVSVGIMKDGGTRYAFNGYVYNREDLTKVVNLTW